jgi:hypothetical protein
MADVYDTTFRTLVYKCSSLVLPLLNETFSENYTGNEKIVFDQNEQMIEVPEEAVKKESEEKNKNSDAKSEKYKERITDTNFTVFAGTNKNYHLECESKPYSTNMLIRLYEYDTQLALRNSVTEGNTIRVKYPNTAVLYLRNISTIPDEMKMIIEVSEGTEIVRNVSVIKMKNYTPEEIIQKKLFILIPFYLFNYEKQFQECNDDPEKLEVILNDLRYLEKELNALVNNGDLDTVHLDVIENCTKLVSDQLAKNYDNVRKGVEDIMVGPIFDFPSTRIIEKSFEDGIEKGIRKTALKMIAAKASDDIISEYTGLSLDEINKLKESVNSEA